MFIYGFQQFSSMAIVERIPVLSDIFKRKGFQKFPQCMILVIDVPRKILNFKKLKFTMV